MPQEPLQDYLERLAVPRELKAQAWDAYNASKTSEDFQKAFKDLGIPQESKAALWDMKFRPAPQPTAIPPVALPSGPPAQPGTQPTKQPPPRLPGFPEIRQAGRVPVTVGGPRFGPPGEVEEVQRGFQKVFETPAIPAGKFVRSMRAKVPFYSAEDDAILLPEGSHPHLEAFVNTVFGTVQVGGNVLETLTTLTNAGLIAGLTVAPQFGVPAAITKLGLAGLSASMVDASSKQLGHAYEIYRREQDAGRNPLASREFGEAISESTVTALFSAMAGRGALHPRAGELGIRAAWKRYKAERPDAPRTKAQLEAELRSEQAGVPPPEVVTAPKILEMERASRAGVKPPAPVDVTPVTVPTPEEPKPSAVDLTPPKIDLTPPSFPTTTPTLKVMQAELRRLNAARRKLPTPGERKVIDRWISEVQEMMEQRRAGTLGLVSRRGTVAPDINAREVREARGAMPARLPTTGEVTQVSDIPSPNEFVPRKAAKVVPAKGKKAQAREAETRKLSEALAADFAKWRNPAIPEEVKNETIAGPLHKKFLSYAKAVIRKSYTKKVSDYLIDEGIAELAVSKAMLKAKTFKGKGKVTTWFWGFVRNEVANARRKAERQQRREVGIRGAEEEFTVGTVAEERVAVRGRAEIQDEYLRVIKGMEDELAEVAGPEALEQVRGVAKQFDKAEDLGTRLGKHEQNLRNAILEAKRKKGEAAPPQKAAEPDVKTLVTSAGGRFEGMQEGIGEHPGGVMITEPTSGSSFLLPLGEITTANIKKGLAEVKRRFEAVAPIEISEPVHPSEAKALGASAEAIARVESERFRGIQRFRIDTRSGKEVPIPRTVDAADVKAQPYEIIVERGPTGEVVLERGLKAREQLPMPSRAELGTKRIDALVKKMEKLGFGKAVKEIQAALPTDVSVEFWADNFRAALARYVELKAQNDPRALEHAKFAAARRPRQRPREAGIIRLGELLPKGLRERLAARAARGATLGGTLKDAVSRLQNRQLPVVSKRYQEILQARRDAKGPTARFAERLAMLPREFVRRYYDRFINIRVAERAVEKAIGRRLDPETEAPYLEARLVFGGEGGPMEAAALRYGNATAVVQRLGLMDNLTHYLDLYAYRRGIANIVRKRTEALRLAAEAKGNYDEVARQVSEGEITVKQGAAKLGRFRKEAAKYRRQAKEFGVKLKKQEVVPKKYNLMTISKELKDIEGSLSKQQFAEIQKAAEAVWALNRRAWDLAHREGIISTEAHATGIALGNEYVPLQRIMEMAQRAGHFGDTNLQLRQQRILRAFKGSTKENLDPLETSLLQHIETIREAGRNRAAKRLIQLREIDPEGFGADVFELKFREQPPANMGQISYFENGRVRSFAVPKNLAQALNELNATDVGFIADTLLKIPKRWFQLGATQANLAFAIPNVARDVQRMAMISEARVRNPKDVALLAKDWSEAFFSTVIKNERYLEFLESRAAYSTLQKNITPEKFLFRGTEKAVPRDPFSRTIRAAFRPLSFTIDSIEKLNSAFEEATKMTTYRELRAKGVGVNEAAFETRRFGGSPDFASGGAYSRELNLLWMFFNANIQGTVGNISRLSSNPKLLGTMMTTVTALALTLHKWNTQFLDDERNPEIYHVSQTERDHNWVILRNSRKFTSAGATRNRYYKIPKPHVVRMLVNPIQEGLIQHSKGQMQKGKLALRAISDLIPGQFDLEKHGIARGLAYGTLSSLNPAIRVPVEVGANISGFRGGAPIESRAMEGIEPRERYTYTTSEVAKWMGKVTNKSPVKIQYAIENMFGGLGQMGLDIGDIAMGRDFSPLPLEGDEAIARTPVLGRIAKRFVGSTMDQSVQDLEQFFYEVSDKANEVKNTTNWKKKKYAETPEVAIDYAIKDPEKRLLYRIQPKLAEIRVELSEIRARRERVIISKKLSIENKRRLLSMLYRQRVQTLTNAIRVLTLKLDGQGQ